MSLRLLLLKSSLGTVLEAYLFLESRLFFAYSWVNQNSIQNWGQYFQIQDLVHEGLLFKVLGIPFSRTDTPFFGCVVIGSVTAVVATLGDVTRLLKIAATSRWRLRPIFIVPCNQRFCVKTHSVSVAISFANTVGQFATVKSWKKFQLFPTADLQHNLSGFLAGTQ